MEQNQHQHTHFLYPANLYVNHEPALVTTILGSCVSVCLFDPIYKVGGINHYMLPFWNGKGLASPKYGNISIEKLIEKLLHLGARKHNLQAKIFGGAVVLNGDFSYYNIGERNIEIAFSMLKEMNIKVLGSSTGGKKGRKILYDTSTGMVKQRYINRQLIKEPIKDLKNE